MGNQRHHSILVCFNIHNMKAFVFAALLSLASAEADAQVPFTAFASGPIVAHAQAPFAHHAVHAPVVNHAFAHHAVHAPVVHHAPVHHAVHAPLVHHAVHAPVHHAVVHHAPVRHAVHHAVHHAPAPVYGCEKKHNCSVVDVVESAEVCTPAFKTVCENIEVPTKIIA